MIAAHHGNCLEVIPRLVAEGVVCDACVTDPPYHLTATQKRFGAANSAPAQYGKDGAMSRLSGGFMGQQWDGGDIAFRPETWATVATILRPGGFLLAFGGTRTYHRLACAIEDAGFVIQDTIAWLYGSGFPKRRDMLKPAFEPIVLAYKPGGKRTLQVDECRVLPTGEKWDRDQSLCSSCAVLAESNARHGTSATKASIATSAAERISSERDTISHRDIAKMDIGCSDGTRTANIATSSSTSASGEPLSVQFQQDLKFTTETKIEGITSSTTCDFCGKPIIAGCIGKNTLAERKNLRPGESSNGHAESVERPLGRWPANLVHDGSEEVTEAFAAFGELQARGNVGPSERHPNAGAVFTGYGSGDCGARYAHDTGSAARFFYCAKADAQDRWGSRHPTVKPVELMKWLVALVTPPGGLVLDPFAGSGTTGVAALATGRDCILIEREAQYLADIGERLAFYEGGGGHSVQAKNRHRNTDAGPLFAQPYDPALDSALSYEAAIKAIGERVKAGEPLPTTGYFGPRG